MLPGVYLNKKKDGTPLYRASITHGGKHISLGSFPDEQTAHRAYLEASSLFTTTQPAQILLDHYQGDFQVLPFEKWVVLLNFRDHGMYIKTPIYLEKRFFTYYYSQTCRYKFDVDDLFYYSNHKIMKRGNHLFVADYGMQVNILSRYGIKNYAVPGRDFRFVNGDDMDYRYRNIEIINRYHGVTKQTLKGREVYTVRIHVNGNIIVGRYATENEAAAAYNRAAMLLKEQGVDKNFPINYIEGINGIEYANLLMKVRISAKIRRYHESRKPLTE
ncbi:MAG: hypothetical protein J6J42_00125 [Lachnospiraceae bacterium]|nr:hypothetical protein [Lachnospiraceae bacterium]MBP3608723.1 hypothetical protein [Lachnospiraceae bacterium]